MNKSYYSLYSCYYLLVNELNQKIIFKDEVLNLHEINF